MSDYYPTLDKAPADVQQVLREMAAGGSIPALPDEVWTNRPHRAQHDVAVVYAGGRRLEILCDISIPAAQRIQSNTHDFEEGETLTINGESWRVTEVEFQDFGEAIIRIEAVE